MPIINIKPGVTTGRSFYKGHATLAYQTGFQGMPLSKLAVSSASGFYRVPLSSIATLALRQPASSGCTVSPTNKSKHADAAKLRRCLRRYG